MSIRDELKQRLAGLALAVGQTPGPRLDAFLDRFGPFLTHYMEYGLLFDAARVAALSIGHGDAFHEALAEWLVVDGIGEAERERVERLRRDVDDWMVLKVDVVGPEPRSVGVYLRRPVPMDAVDAVLAAEGATEATVRKLGRVAGLLDAPCAQILALVLGRFGPELKLYFALGPGVGGAALARVEGAFAALEVPFDAARRYLEAYGGSRAATSSGLLLSAFIGHGSVRPIAKIDLFGVPLSAVDRAVEAAEIPLQGLPAPSELGSRVGLDTAEHVGALFRADGAPALSVYFPFER